MVEKKEPNYNPADYAQLQAEAKAMDKKELEDYYVKVKDNTYVSCGKGWAIAIGIIVTLAFLIGVGYAISKDITIGKVAGNMEDISAEVCPMIGEGYASSEAIHTNSYETRIVCNEFNSIPK